MNHFGETERVYALAYNSRFLTDDPVRTFDEKQPLLSTKRFPKYTMVAGKKTNPHASALPWTMGFISASKKYLTAEIFNHKLNVTAPSLKKKQIWVIEADPDENGVFHMRSHLKRYLSVDSGMTVVCTSTHRTSDTQWLIEYSNENSGRWAIINRKQRVYLEERGTDCVADSQVTNENSWWTPHLAVHPQISLRNVNRDRYAHLIGEEIQCNELIPWGADALITLEYIDGKYAVKTSDNRYLRRDGALVTEADKNTMYSLILKSHPTPSIAFKDITGLYLTHATASVMQSLGSKVTKDEMFVLEDNQPQATLFTHTRKYISIRQGADLVASQAQATDTEIFQFEFDRNVKKWLIRTVNNDFWVAEEGKTIHANATELTSDCFFSLEWLDGGKVAIQTTRGKYIDVKQTGSLTLKENPTEKGHIQFRLVNRPLIILRCQFGFVGLRNGDSKRLECNRTKYEVYRLSQEEDGMYNVRGPNGCFWRVEEDSHVNVDGTQPYGFQFEFHTDAKLAIKAANGLYLRGEQNGLFTASSSKIDSQTLWEF